MFMMIIIDDDPKMSEKLKHALEAHHIKSVFTFTSTKNCSPELISKASLIFLDIEMPDDNGMEFAKRIRKNDADKKIIFISSHEQYVFDSFAAQPFYFIRKTDFENDFAKAMREYQKVHAEEQKLLHYKIDRREYLIKMKSIIRIEKCDCRICIHTINGKVIKISEKLKNIIDDLDENFVFIDRSNILNMYYLKELDGIYAVLNTGDKLEVSRRRRQLVKDALMDYIRRSNS